MLLKLFLFATLLLKANAWCNDFWIGEMEITDNNNHCGIHDGREGQRELLNEWTVVVDGDEEAAQLVALEIGYLCVGKVKGFTNTYIFEKPDHKVQRRTFQNSNHTYLVHRQIKWAQQMFLKLRAKRYPADREIYRSKRVEGDDNRGDEEAVFRKPVFNDELWADEWYLQDSRDKPYSVRLDHNVMPVYEMGFTGKGVRVSILDDGIEHTHTDLQANYDPEISWDCNDRDSDPSPRQDDLKGNSHGTRCAGEIAMAANNNKCGVGVAWGARIGGVRMLDGKISDRLEGEAISYAFDKVDIYSVSWGPYDDGSTVEGPGEMASEAIRRGIHKGRKGRGSIYVWANGNGGAYHDNCNCDGYSASIYTISVASASQQGLFPWYGEVCPSTLVTAYSSGSLEDQKIATTDTNNSCTRSHTGTSAAAPLAAGIIALVLEANPYLTWRDVQHLIVWTSNFLPLIDNPGWMINGMGLVYNIRFGFGLLNAGALVTAALDWVNVPDQHVCRIAAAIKPSEVPLGSRKEDVINIEVEEDFCSVKFVEHVEVIVNIQYSRRGALEMYLTSPRGTAVQLLSPRPNDRSTKGFVNWSLMSVATWGETPYGEWKVTIKERTSERNYGFIESLMLVVYGTNSLPEKLLNRPRQYEKDYKHLAAEALAKLYKENNIDGNDIDINYNQINEDNTNDYNILEIYVNNKEEIILEDLEDDDNLENWDNLTTASSYNEEDYEQELLRHHHTILYH